MKIISFKICPFVQRVTATLEAKKVPYELEYISLADPPSWFLKTSPNAQVPLLITDRGVALFESDAIIEYLDEIHEPLQKDTTPEERAVNRAWCYQASKHYLVQCGAMQSPDGETLATRSEKLGKAFAKVEKVLGKHSFFGGERIGNVDMAWLVLLHRASIIERRTGYDFLAGYPKVKAWQANLMETEIISRSVSDDFESAFCDFYLSEKTHLGRTTGSASEFSTPKKQSCCG